VPPAIPPQGYHDPESVKGPAETPLLLLSLMATVRSVPGIMAPESAITKDEAKIVIKIIIIYVPSSKIFETDQSICLLGVFSR
jgi:hypothetical protein